MKKLDFTLKNVISCVHNEPTLWDTEFTDIHPEITVYVSTHIIGFHFWKHSAIPIIMCLSPIYCLTHVECFRFFMAANIDFV